MIEASPKTSILWRLLLWHFISGPKLILLAWRNFLLFNFKYFSIKQLLKTFLSPYRRYKDSYGRGFDASRYLQTFIGNLMSRILGAVVRLLTIIVGLVIEVFIFIGGLVMLIVWLLLPVILFLAFAFSISILV